MCNLATQQKLCNSVVLTCSFSFTHTHTRAHTGTRWMPWNPQASVWNLWRHPYRAERTCEAFLSPWRTSNRASDIQKYEFYNQSRTKRPLWPVQRQRGDADCWYFCLFKLFNSQRNVNFGLRDVRGRWRRSGVRNRWFESKKKKPTTTTRQLASRLSIFSITPFLFCRTSLCRSRQ